MPAMPSQHICTEAVNGLDFSFLLTSVCDVGNAGCLKIQKHFPLAASESGNDVLVSNSSNSEHEFLH